MGTNSFCASPDNARNGKDKDFRVNIIINVARGGCCDGFGDWYNLGTASMRLTATFRERSVVCRIRKPKFWRKALWFLRSSLTLDELANNNGVEVLSTYSEICS